MRYLNATCVSEETLGFAYIDTTTFNVTTCAIHPPFFYVHGTYWTPVRIILLVCLFLSVMAFVWIVTHIYEWCSMIRRLRSLPTARVHETIEVWAEQSLSGHARRRFKKYEKGRFTSATEFIDQAAQTRTVVIVEDLSKKPLTSRERRKMPKVPKGWTSGQDRDVVPGELAADIALERVGSEAQLAVMDQAHVSENEGTPEIDIGAGSPAYKHFV